MSEKKLIADVNGLKIREESIYEVTHRVDHTAPDGFVNEGATKLPSMEIGSSVPCPFVETNKVTGEGVYDSGFYIESPCYQGMKKEEVRKIVSTLRDKIMYPYEAKFGKGILDHQNESFWDNFNVDLYAGRYFSTEDVESLLHLYIAMRGFELLPKDSNMKGSPKFKDAQYSIEDKNTVRNIKEERAVSVLDALVQFGKVLEKDKEVLVNMLKYLRLIGFSRKMDEVTMKASFYEWLNKSVENPDKWKRVYDMYLDDKKIDIINLFVSMNKLTERGIITREGGHYIYKGQRIGSDLQNAAEKIVMNEDMISLKTELLEIEI